MIFVEYDAPFVQKLLIVVAQRVPRGDKATPDQGWECSQESGGRCSPRSVQIIEGNGQGSGACPCSKPAEARNFVQIMRLLMQ